MEAKPCTSVRKENTLVETRLSTFRELEMEILAAYAVETHSELVVS